MTVDLSKKFIERDKSSKS